MKPGGRFTPVADLQGVQFMIADSAMKLEAARQLTYAAAAKSERAMPGEKVADLTFFSSACNRRPSVIVTGRTNTPGGRAIATSENSPRSSLAHPS